MNKAARTALPLIGLLFISGLLLNAVISTQTQTSAGSWVSENDFTAWVSERAIMLEKPGSENWGPSALSPLDGEIEGKRVVYLGEPDHYIREKFEYQAVFIRYLYDLGFRHVGMEVGIFDGRRVDRYIATGDESWLNRIRLLGYTGEMRRDRDDQAYWVAARENPEFKDGHRSELRWFFNQLRRLNEDIGSEDDRLHFFGFDVDVHIGAGYDEVRRRLDKHAAFPRVKEILSGLERVQGETIPEEVARISTLIESVESGKSDLRSGLGESIYSHLLRDLHSLKGGLTFLSAYKQGPSATWLPGLRDREEVMFRQMDELLSDFKSEERMILIAHNLHLSKDYSRVGFGSQPMWPSVGTHVANRLPGKVYSIWMLYDHGRHGNVSRPGYFEEVPSHPSRIERLFAGVGECFVLPLNSGDPREAYLNSQRNFVLNGGVGSGILSRQADAFYFLSQVTPVRKR